MIQSNNSRPVLMERYYAGSIQQLAVDIHGMDYAMVVAFYEHTTVVLLKEARKNKRRGRRQLNSLLKKAAKAAKKQGKQFARIHKLYGLHDCLLR